jgi:hypothetical protein
MIAQTLKNIRRDRPHRSVGVQAPPPGREYVYVVFAYDRMVWGMLNHGRFILPGGLRADTIGNPFTTAVLAMDTAYGYSYEMHEDDFSRVSHATPGGRIHVYYTRVDEDEADFLTPDAVAFTHGPPAWVNIHDVDRHLDPIVASMVRTCGRALGIC